jgi:NADH:ubiquinone oxidoreductase subunit 5 (subunit L)/multisubunit Na+/H+ antiporter MnhA subunit
MMEMVNVSWIVTLLAILVLFFIQSDYKAYIAVFSVLINSLVTSWLAFPAMAGQVVELPVFAGTFLGDIAIRIDGLSAWFILIINFTSLTGVI